MMKVELLQEPELEFGAGRHIDVRFGIADYGPFDRPKASPANTIRLGVVGTSQTLDGLLNWWEKCKGGVPAKESKQPKLFPAFPGFGDDSCFTSSLLCESRCQRTLASTAFEKMKRRGNHNAMVEEAVDLFLSELDDLATNTSAQVLVCAPPVEFFDLVDPGALVQVDDDDDEEPEDPEFKTGRFIFHHILKARGLRLKKPIQLVRPRTYGGNASRSQRRKTKAKDPRPLQDEATRAWNFHTAVYYKAGGVPWRMVRDSSELTTCYVGISFYRSLDEATVLTSLAQVFNERGDGLVVRGGQARVSKEDRVPHLPLDAAEQVLAVALKSYRSTHKTTPARVVVHKSSDFLPDEREGFLRALAAERIEYCDLLSIRRSFTRLFRIGVYPPLRGTLLEPQPNEHILYTRGSVPFFEAYPGMYVPRPMDIRYEQAEQSPRFLAKEILSLTKMNWNNTQFDGGEPITLRAARQAGAILKYVNEADPIHPRYSFYM